ncbi:MAG: hypothetical protein AB7O74_05545 [Candidatus Nanopelagicales bacterium]
MIRLRTALGALVGSDEGQSLVELAARLVVAFVLVGLLFAAYNTIVAGGRVPLEQCIEHESCQAAQQAHGF